MEDGGGVVPFVSRGAVRLVAACTALAAVFCAAYLGVRGDENAGLLLLAAAACAAVALLRLLVSLLQRFDGGGAGGLWAYERESVVIVLVLASLALPWRIEIALAGAAQIMGWQSLAAWLAAIALVPALSRRLAHWEIAGLALSGAGLAVWLGWCTWVLFTPSFTRLHFPFQPLDLLGIGWYLAVAAWVLAVDGAAARRGWEQSGAAGRAALLAWAVVPGAGLVRAARPALGRVYLLAAGFTVFLLHLTVYTPTDFAYNAAASNRLPPPAPRTDALVLLAVLAALWAVSIVHTLRSAVPSALSGPLESPEASGRR